MKKCIGVLAIKAGQKQREVKKMHKNVQKKRKGHIGSLLAGVFALVMMMTLIFPLNVCAGNVITGTMGDNGGIQWSYDESTKVLTVTGEDSGMYGRRVYYNGANTLMSPFVQVCPDIEKIIMKDCTLHEEVDALFMNLKDLKTVEFKNFDTSNVTNMRSMFNGCVSLEKLDVSSFDTSNVTDMALMFCDCESLTNLDLSNFDTSKVTDMAMMFYCFKKSSLTKLDVSSFDTSKVTDMGAMFMQCDKLIDLNVSRFDTSNVRDMGSMFHGCSSLTYLNVSGFNTSKATGMVEMFSGCSGLTKLDVSNFDTSNVTNIGGMFSNCSSLTSLDVSGFDTSSMTQMWEVFNGCSGLTSLDVSNFDTSNVEAMVQMFRGCSGLTSLNVSNFDTSKVWVTEGMFENCSSLTSLNLSNFDTSNVTIMSDMFSGCSNLAILDISSFDTSKASYTCDDMLDNCLLLSEIHSPKAMSSTQSVDLPAEFRDSKGTITEVLTAEFCNDTLNRATPFVDVPYYKWYYKYVKAAYDRGIMAGTSTTADGLVKFEPESRLTREQFVQILYAMEGKPAVTFADTFSDVKEGEWYANAVIWASENELVSGVGDSEFGVNTPITREQLALILFGYANKYKGYETAGRADISAFADVADVSNWAEEALKWAVHYGIMSGTGDKLNPKGATTRAEAATMLVAFINCYEE